MINAKKVSTPESEVWASEKDISTSGGIHIKGTNMTQWHKFADNKISPLNKMEQYEAAKFLDAEDAKFGENGYLEYSFGKSCGIGSAITVRHSATKAKKDITDYSSW